jgi:hypothetical protein
MKKLLLTAMLIMAGMIGFAQNPITYQKNGKTYIKIEETQSKGKKGKSSYLPTGKYVEFDGKDYQVYTHVFTKGERQGQTGYFIEVVSKKSGKPYWKEVTISNG